MGILGDHTGAIRDSADPCDQLIAAAELHHAFSFDPIGECPRRLEYEPRCSASCDRDGCRTIWVGSKAGEILQLDCESDALRPSSRRLDRGVRALVHVHRRRRLIAGTDSGHLVVFGDGLVDEGCVQLEHCYETAGEEPCCGLLGPPIEDRLDEHRYYQGITAMLELPSIDADPVDLVVATRYAGLFVVRLHDRGIEIRARHQLPGWTRCMATVGPPGDEVLVCATPSGEIVEWRCRDLHADPATAPRCAETTLLPTAIGRHSGQLSSADCALVGARDGVYLHDVGGSKPVLIAPTRTAVLSIATVVIRRDRDTADSKAYVALGLEDGRVRVIEERALFGSLDGNAALQAHDFPVDLRNSVLALEIIATEEPTSCFVLAGLRDHRLHLFRVRDREALYAQLRDLWKQVVPEPEPIAASLESRLASSDQLRAHAGPKREQALRYLLVDDVLPRWARELGTSAPRLVEYARAIAADADEKVLYRLSANIGAIAHGDAQALIRLSMACLRAMPQREAGRWRAFASYHLKQFHACARRIADRRDIARLQLWGRFVRKYVFLGERFADKRFGIKRLMQRNEATHKYLDALIYAAQLERQRYDLAWETTCKDKDGRISEIARVDLFDHAAIVTTTSAEVMLFHVDGEPMAILDAGRRCDRLTPPRGTHISGKLRTRASRVVRKHAWIRIALSWASPGEPRPDELRVTIFDLALEDRHAELIATHDATTGGYRREEPGEVAVHGLVGLPNEDAFLVGLDSSEQPLGLLEPIGDGRTWKLLPLDLSRPRATPSAPVTALSTPVRAVAVLALDSWDGDAGAGPDGRGLTPRHYLAAAGAADGSLRFAVFDLTGKVIAVDMEPTLLVYPINDVALTARPGDTEYQHVCYAGTETGVSFGLLVGCSASPGGTPAIAAKPLWRDLHGSPVIAVRPWAKKEDSAASDDGAYVPLFDEPVVFVAAQSGHISIYHGKHGPPTQVGLSGALNYRFQGMRFMRIDLPDRLTSWAIRQGRSQFLAAYPNGRLLFGELYGPLGSANRVQRKAAIDALYARTVVDRLFFGIYADEAQKLEICAMVRITGGALRRYVFRKQLEQLSWDDLTGAQIEEVLAAHLGRLDPEVPEERDRIKVVIRMVSTTVLDRHPDKIFDECRPGRVYNAPEEYRRLVPAYRRLTQYLLDGAVQPGPGVVRVRMVIMTALFRANVFRHLPIDQQGTGEIEAGLRDVLTACLRDDDRVERVEALRAVSVALRNISILFERAKADEAHLKSLRRRFFPNGLGTIQWLVDVVLENHARYRQHGEPVLLSTAWSYITALVAVIRLFPGDTLELCDQITRRGLGDNLPLIVERLRGQRAQTLRDRITKLYIVPPVRAPTGARDEFNREFDNCDVNDTLTGLKIAGEDSDSRIATELLHIYRRLALLWKPTDDKDIAEVPLRASQAGQLPVMTGNRVDVRSILDEFVMVAGQERQQRLNLLADLRTRIATAARDRRKPPDAVHLVLERIVEHWRSVLEPRIPRTGDKVGTHTLGRLITERENGQVFAVQEDAGRVIKILRHSMERRREFNRDVRLSRELAERYQASFVAVHSLEPRSGYAVMDAFTIATDVFSSPAADRPKLAAIAAQQLTRAVRYLHAEGLAHGDLRAENVFVSMDGSEPTFRLGDLHVRDDGTYSQGALQVPGFLRKAKPAETRIDHWIDLVALILLLHWMLTGETLGPDADEGVFNGLPAQLATRGYHKHVVVHAIGFLRSNILTTAERLETLVSSGRQGFERRMLAGRPTARFDVFLSYDSQDIKVARALYAQLTERGLVPYLDVYEVVSDRWRLDLRVGMDQCRAFAILVGNQYRPRTQAEEVRIAREESIKYQLPFQVFLLGAHRPADFRDDPVIEVGGDVVDMAKRIAASFTHPIAQPGR